MLDRVHKIADIIAAFAIVASLVFVGIQVRQNTIGLGAASSQSAMNAWNDNALAIATNEKLAERWLLRRYPVFVATQDLDAADFQLLMFISASMNTLDNQYLAYLDGKLNEETWAGFKGGLTDSLITNEYYSSYWNFSRDLHSVRFQLLIDELMLVATERRQRYADSVGFRDSE